MVVAFAFAFLGVLILLYAAVVVVGFVSIVVVVVAFVLLSTTMRDNRFNCRNYACN